MCHTTIAIGPASPGAICNNDSTADQGTDENEWGYCALQQSGKTLKNLTAPMVVSLNLPFLPQATS